MVVSDQAPPRFSRDGQRLYLGHRATTAPPAAEGAPEPRAVDIWNWQDPYLQPMQRVRAQQERNRNYRAMVYTADKRLVQLATTDLPNVNVDDDATIAVGTSELAYRQRGLLGHDLQRHLRSSI